MVERAGGLCLTQQACPSVGILRDRRRQELQGDLAIQAFVIGEVDDPLVSSNSIDASSRPDLGEPSGLVRLRLPGQ